MARVFVYERSLDTLLVDSKVYATRSYVANGLKIKKENEEGTHDTGAENLMESALVTKKTGTLVENEVTTPERQVSQNRATNKENESLVSQENTKSKGNQIDINRCKKERKRTSSEMRTSKNHQKLPRKRKKQSGNVTENDKESPAKKKSKTCPQKGNEKCKSKQATKKGKPEVSNQPPSMKVSYECSVCFLDFQSLKKLQLHMKHNRRPRRYTCDSCPGTYSTRRKLSYHMISCAHNKENSKYQCYFCGLKCNLKRNLQLHLFHIHGNLIHSPETSDNAPKTKTDESDKTGTHTNPIKVSDDKPQHITCSNQNGTVSVSTPVKKMRQSTLTEFLQVSTKQNEEPVNSEKLVTPDESTTKDQAVEQSTPSSAMLPTSAMDVGSSNVQQTTSEKVDVPATSSASKKPFVQIHTNVDLMMVLLKDTMPDIKTEKFDEDWDSISTSHTVPYSLRNVSSSRSSGFYEDPIVRYRKRKRSTKEQESSIPAKRLHQDETEPSVINRLKAKFKCKELTIRLVRCNKELDVKTPSNTDSPSSEKAVKVNNGKPFRCKVCDRGFSSKENVQEHMELFHVAYMSSICSARYISRNKLMYHYYRHHGSYKRNVCCVCDKAFNTRFELKRHLLVHCVKIFRRQKDSFSASSNAKCNAFKKSHKCTHCGKRFWLGSCLKQHQDLCHAENKVKQGKTPCVTEDSPSVRSVDEKKVDNDNNTVVTDTERQSNINPSISIQSSPSNRLPDSPRQNHTFHTPTKQIGTLLNTSTPVTSIGQDTLIKHNLSTVATPTTPKRHFSLSPGCLTKKESRRIFPLQSTLLSSPKTDVQAFNVPTSNVPDSSSKMQSSPRPRKNKNYEKELNIVRKKVDNNVDILNSAPTQYQCTVCNKNFRTFKGLYQHQLHFSRPANHLCKICSTAFTTKKLLQIHHETTHVLISTTPFKHQCRFCNQGFITDQNRRTHESHLHAHQLLVNPVETQTNKEEVFNVDMVCNVCNLMFETYDRFIEHNMYYYKDHMFTCTFCGESFQGMYKLHHHNKLVHYPEDVRKSYTYTCDKCNEGFKHELHFHAHKSHVHLSNECTSQNNNLNRATLSTNKSCLASNNTALTDDKQLPMNTYSCEICHLHFTNNEDLATHKAEYSMDGKFKCDKCEKRFCTAILLKKHQSLNHSNWNIDSKYRCRFCNEVMTTNTSMTCHEKHFHDNTSISEAGVTSGDKSDGTTNCSDTISNQKDITVNKVVEGDNGSVTTDDDNFPCTTCGMRFDNKTNLRDHLLEFSDIGDHVCEICQRRFVEFERLQLHRLKHSRLNAILSDHQCPICHEGFIGVAHVRTHVLHLHGYETFQNILTRRSDHSKINKPSNNELAAQKESSAVPTNDCDTNTCEANVDSNKAPFTDTEKKQAKTTTPVASTVNTAEKPKNVKCSVCGLKFVNKKNLMKHEIRYMNQGHYVCEICGRRFPWLSVFKDHHRKHFYGENVSMLKYICPHCGERFRTLNSAHSHVIHLHAKSKNEVATTNNNDNNDVEVSQSTKANDCTLSVSGNDALVWKEILPSEPTNGQDISELEIFDHLEKDPLEIDDENAIGIFDGIYMPEGSDEANSSGVNPIVDIMDEDTIIVENNANFPQPGQVAISYTCPVCLAVFSSLSSFQVHFRFNHPKSAKQSKILQRPLENTNVECVICESIFANEPEFKEHLDKVHMPSLYYQGNKTGQRNPSDNNGVMVEVPTSTTDSNDGLEVVWQKKLEKHIMLLNNRDKDQEKIKDSEVQKLTTESESMIMEESTKVGKLKVKPFAKIIETLSRSNISNATTDSDQNTRVTSNAPNMLFSHPKTSLNML